MRSRPGATAAALSAFSFSATRLPPRRPSSAVTRMVDPQSVMRAGECIGREAAEHHRMYRADPRAGQHRDRGFGDHRHVQRDARALHRARRLQDVGEAADLGVKVAVSQRAGVFRRFVGVPRRSRSGHRVRQGAGRGNWRRRSAYRRRTSGRGNRPRRSCCRPRPWARRSSRAGSRRRARSVSAPVPLQHRAQHNRRPRSRSPPPMPAPAPCRSSSHPPDSHADP